MSKSIISVEFEIPGHSDKYLEFSSDKSLLDFDIIVFQPDIHSYVSWSEQYQDKPSLNENQSFRLKEQTTRWRQELLNAFNHGKTIFIFMSELVEVFVDTGRRDYSGTGRNSRVTTLVEPFNNYSTLPISFEPIVNARGKEIKTARDLKMLAPYWEEFKGYTQYDVYFASKDDLVKTTALKIVNEGLVHGEELQVALNEPSIVVNQIVTLLENEGMFEVYRYMGGPCAFRIGKVSAELKRWLRSL